MSTFSFDTEPSVDSARKAIILTGILEGYLYDYTSKPIKNTNDVDIVYTFKVYLPNNIADLQYLDDESNILDYNTGSIMITAKSVLVRTFDSTRPLNIADIEILSSKILKIKGIFTLYLSQRMAESIITGTGSDITICCKH